MRLPLAEGSSSVLLVHLALAWLGFQVHCGLGLVALAGFVFGLFFFRDFERAIPAGPPRRVFSAADGKVLGIDEVYEESFVGGPCLRVSVFMSLFDAHVNRMPVAGEIELLAHRAGGFEAAWAETAAEKNEAMDVGIRTREGHRVLCRQVAGLVARRIVCRLRVGEQRGRGERFGMIRYGSRADHFLPLGTEVRVAVGEQVYAGLTHLADLPEAGKS